MLLDPIAQGHFSLSLQYGSMEAANLGSDDDEREPTTEPPPAASSPAAEDIKPRAAKMARKQ
jgi:hypothetical protein